MLHSCGIHNQKFITDSLNHKARCSLSEAVAVVAGFQDRAGTCKPVGQRLLVTARLLLSLCKNTA